MLAAPRLSSVARPSEDPQANKYTILGLRSIVSYISTSSYGIWQEAILLLLHLRANSPTAERFSQALKDWEDQGAVDWEHTLMLVVAQYTLPSSRSRVLGKLPAAHLAIGDVCSFDDNSGGRLVREATSDGSQPHVEDQGHSSVKPDSSLTATSSLASYGERVTNHTVNSGVMWTSYIVDLTGTRPGWGNPQTATFGMDITLNLQSQHSHTVWCNMRHILSSDAASGHGLNSLSELELVVSISVISRIHLNAALSGHWNEIISYLDWEERRRRGGEGSETPNTIAEDNPFARMKLYFHRHDTASASPREYWGFWSLSSDPTAETGLEDCEAEIKMEVTTLPMENELDKKIKRREEERLAGIPGGWN